MYIFARMLEYVDFLGRVMFAKNMFVCGFLSYSRIFHSGDVTITGEGLQIVYLCETLMAIEQWEFFSLPHLLWHGASIYDGDLRDTHTYCRAFGSWAVTTCNCFHRLVRFRLDSNNYPSACGANALTHRTESVKVAQIAKYFKFWNATLYSRYFSCNHMFRIN